MRNHAEKQRDMARSVLPSTARKTARWARRHSHKTARRSIRATLHAISSAEHPDDVDAPLDRYRHDMHGTTSGWPDEFLVGARRAADKVGPIVRWATSTIARSPHLSDGDYWVRRNHFKAILPDTLQGRHALSHLEGLFGPDYIESLQWFQRRERYAANRRRVEAEYHDRKAKLLEVLRTAGERRLDERIAALTAPIRMVEIEFRVDGRRYVRTVARPIIPRTIGGSDPDTWLGGQPDSRRRAHDIRWGVYEIAIAHRALDEVHAEMFGGRLIGEPPTPGGA